MSEHIVGEGTTDSGSRRGFLAQTLVGGAAMIGGAAALTPRGVGAQDRTLALERGDPRIILEQEVKALKMLYSDPDRAPIHYVSGPRLGREILFRLEFSRQQTDNPELIEQIDQIAEAIKLGDELVRAGDLLCW